MGFKLGPGKPPHFLLSSPQALQGKVDGHNPQNKQIIKFIMTVLEKHFVRFQAEAASTSETSVNFYQTTWHNSHLQKNILFSYVRSARNM
jgi:hypothetical protein